MKFSRFKKFFYFLILASSILGSGIGACGNNTIYNLSHPPSGFMFTDGNGNTISTAASGSTVQLRSESTQNIVFQFQISGDVNFQNVIAGRDLTESLLYFPNNSDKSGITGNVILYTPCNPSQNAVRICPSSNSITSVAPACSNQAILSSSNSNSGNYSWANSSRSGITDCQVQADISNFNIGAAGTILLPYYFSFQPPPGYVGPAETCDLQCSAPGLSLGGVVLEQEMKFNPAQTIQSPIDTLEGSTLILTTTGTNPALNPNYISANLDPLPTFTWSFIDSSNVTLDIYGYNFLLQGQQYELPSCTFTCEQFPVPGATFDFSINGSSFTQFTVTGFNGSSAYFVDPNDLSPIFAALNGGTAGTSTLVITDGGNSTPLSFTLGENAFANLSGFEILDLNNGVANSVSLNAAALLAFSNNGTLQIEGTSLDNVVLTDSNPWTLNSSPININGSNYNQYQSGTATLWVQQGIQVQN